MSAASDNLSPQQRTFCHEYLKDFVAWKAYGRAYPEATAKNSKQQGARRMMKNPDVVEYIDELVERRNMRTDVDADRVILELARIGFSDLREVMSWGAGGSRWKESDTISDNAAAAIAEITETKRIYEDEDGGETVTSTRKLKLHSKMSALTELAKHTGVNQDRGAKTTVNVNVPGKTPEEVDAEYAKLYEEIENLPDEEEAVPASSEVQSARDEARDRASEG